ncbi:MAG: putative S-layer protein [archaeon]|nr:putative S-layer protein [archaeon]
MNQKTLSLMCASVLLLVFTLSITSAALTFTNIPTLSQTGTSAQITITSDQNETVTFSGLTAITESDKTISFSPLAVVSVVANTPRVVTINYNVPVDFGFLLGRSYSTVLTATGSVSPANTQNLIFTKEQYCSIGNKGNLEILNLDIVNSEGFGQDDTEWYPLDKISVDVEIRNDGTTDIDNIVVEWGVYNPKTGDWVINEDEKSFDLRDKKSNTLTMEFTVDPKDFDLSTKDYVFYIKAYSEDSAEDTLCVSSSRNIKLMAGNDFVILNELKASAETVACGQEFQLTSKVWNIGEDDQEGVYVVIYNEELGINQKVEIGDIDSFDSEKLSASLKIPDNAKQKTYPIEFEVYSEDDEIYTSEDDDESRFTIPIKVDGCIITPQAVVTANIQSGGEAGKELVIKSTVKNTGSSSVTYVMKASGYDSWATLKEITPGVLTLNAGETKEVLYKFDVLKGASGDKTFNIEVKTGDTDAETLKQPVVVSITSSSFSITSLTSKITGNAIGSNWYLWGIGALNVILIIIIIVVAMKVARG